MAPEQTGFDGDDFEGRRYDGIYEGTVVDRDDPDGDARVRVRIPGIIDDRSAWARPRGGGSMFWGFVAVPPLEADVYIQFINGNIDRPVYEAADFGTKDGVREMFPEHEHPDVIVAGFGPFRVVIDLRKDQGQDIAPTFTIKQVATMSDDSETDTAWVQLRDNSVWVHGDSAAAVDSGGITSVDSAGDVQIRGRKVMPGTKVIP